MSRRTDEEWLSDLRAAGHVQRQAFDDLGRYLYTVIYNYLRKRRTGLPRLRGLDHTELEALTREFTQEALQTVWEKLSTYEGRGKLTSWAATIAVRTAAYEVRKPYWQETRMPQSPADDPDNDPEEWGGPKQQWQEKQHLPPEVRVLAGEVIDIIETTVERDLSERQRFAFVAQFLEDRSTEEIADDLGTTRNAVYMLIHEARKKIKRRLLEAGHTPETVLQAFQGEG